ncbi:MULTISPECIES: DUF6660 family protein [unclassified Mucilaginibacter]|uniref:DUF6660 family protein n=1 Tax=unclassified Mucilaginibacter TaxID=2617802 RepID=UPI0033989E2D
MKLLCILFSFVVFFLSVKPCCTDSDCDTGVKTEQGAASNAKDCAGCSPFFSCGTCAGFTVAKTATITLPANSAKLMQSYPAYQQPNVKDVVLAIWQPPKLG